MNTRLPLAGKLPARAQVQVRSPIEAVPVTSTIAIEPTESTAPTDGPVHKADDRHWGLSKSRWERVGLIVLLVGTAVAYLWNITINGMGNQFYAGGHPSRCEGLESPALRFARHRKLHHRRQTAGLAVGDGSVRSALRFQ